MNSEYSADLFFQALFSKSEKGVRIQKLQVGLDMIEKDVLKKFLQIGFHFPISLSFRQCLRLSPLRTCFGWTVRELASETDDSLSVRSFLELPSGRSLSKSLVDKACRALPIAVLDFAATCLARKMETETDYGKMAWTQDTTTVSAWTAYPNDSKVLLDLIRVGTRVVEFSREHGLCIKVEPELSQNAKKKQFQISCGLKSEAKKEAYFSLIQAAQMVKNEMKHCQIFLDEFPDSTHNLGRRKRDAVLFSQNFQAVISQADRRILKGEKVENEEKKLSIFEDQVYVLEKGGRETEFGSKVNLVKSSSGVLLDVQLLPGNQSDQATFMEGIEGAFAVTGLKPSVCIADGGYANPDNYEDALDFGLDDVYFSCPKGMTVEEMMPEEEYRNVCFSLRAGIESVVSEMKRTFGLSRVVQKSKKGLQRALKLAHFFFNAQRLELGTAM